MTFAGSPVTCALWSGRTVSLLAEDGEGSEARVELKGREPIFIGCKLEGPLRRRLESIMGPDRKYVSREDSSYLRICRLADAEYVGKVIHERLSTERVDDVRRNVLSILQRLCPEVRLPSHLDILACSTEDVGVPASIGDTKKEEQGS